MTLNFIRYLKKSNKQITRSLDALPRWQKHKNIRFWAADIFNRMPLIAANGKYTTRETHPQSLNSKFNTDITILCGVRSIWRWTLSYVVINAFRRLCCENINKGARNVGRGEVPTRAYLNTNCTSVIWEKYVYQFLKLIHLQRQSTNNYKKRVTTI